MSQAIGNLSISLALLVGLTSAVMAADEPSRREAGEFFETSIRPVLSESCLNCHGPKKQSSGLRLDSREAILKGGDLGPALVPGKPAESLLIQALEHTHEDLKMPPKGKLPGPAIAAFRKWIEIGAPWAEEHPLAAVANAADPKQHWAFAPLKPVALPDVKDKGWVRTPVDAFILARLEKDGIKPSPPADRRTLIRRATIDLIGIPPTASEIAAFEADRSPQAFEKVVDRLLASPLYGERWGRHWLDVARYADTKGYVFTEDRLYPYAYTYRDFVVDAFNEDHPFDRFIVEQLAADQLELGSDPRPLAAMGFLTVGRRFLNDQNEIIDDRIDLVGRGLLGLSLSCARCHDHKFDPIPSEDYYSLYGVFASSVEPGELPRLRRPGLVHDPETEAHGPAVDKARKERDDFVASRRAEVEKDFRGRFSEYFRAAYAAGLKMKGPKLAAIAAERKLDAHRLNAAMALLRHRTERAEAAKDPLVGPLAAFSRLPKDKFEAGAAEVCRGLAATAGKPGGPHPLVAALFLGRNPTSLDDVAARYAGLLATVEGHVFDRPFADPPWDSLRLLIHGPHGLASMTSLEPKFAIHSQPDIEKYAELENALKAVEAKWTGRAGRAMVMHDSPHPVEPRVFLRGNPGRPGKPVPRQFLQVLAGPERKPFKKGSGRLELASAIVDPANPLTARVLANRIWGWHFGQALVTTPSDFGLRCDPPSHPELLDDLAITLRDGGWSVKALHRRIMLSSTYQQRSDLRPEVHDRDPQNRLVWRFNRLRMDFEAMRDSVLAAAGTLDRTMGGPSIMLGEPPFTTRRTIYGFIDRQNLDSLYRTFDFAVPDATSPKRFVTTVPTQSLFLMNSPFVQEQATRLASSVDRESASTSDGSADPLRSRARTLYRRVLGREPEASELEMAARFLDPSKPRDAGESLPRLAQLAQVLLLTNEFTFVD